MPNLFTDPEAVWSVSQLTNQVKAHLEPAFSFVRVAGEISGIKKHAAGHIYADLKDPCSQIPIVFWRSILARFSFQPRNGMEVIIRGRISIYPPQGRYQLEVEHLDPKGIGAAELALRQLRERLLAKGYFDPRRKRAVPRFPRRLALVTSPSGAAVHDVLERLGARWPLAGVLVYPVRVQGDGAAAEIAAAVRQINRFHALGWLRFDAMIVGRGGGRVVDLSAFNEEIVADAIFESRIPVISAVGHQIDNSVADDVADIRATTPTDAANRAVPDRADLMAWLRDLCGQMETAVRQRIRVHDRHLGTLAAHGVFRQPLERVREREMRLDDIGRRLHRVIVRLRDQAAERVAAIAGRLDTLSPLNVLRRGYSLTRTETSPTLLRDAAAVQPGERLITTLASGFVVSRVESVSPGSDDASGISRPANHSGASDP